MYQHSVCSAMARCSHLPDRQISLETLRHVISGTCPAKSLCSSHRSHAGSRLSLRVCAAKGAKSRNARRGGGKGRGKRGESGMSSGSGNSKPLSPELQMSQFKRDEVVMFDSVKAAPGALQIVYAYPNDYTVGITSLGYQLVCPTPLAAIATTVTCAQTHGGGGGGLEKGTEPACSWSCCKLPVSVKGRYAYRPAAPVLLEGMGVL